MSNYQHKRSQVAGKIPLAGDLLEGEIAVNIKDRKLFSKDDQGVVFEFLGGNSGGVETVNGISPVSGNVTLNALNIPPTADRLWLTQAERQLIAGFDAYDKTESDDRYLLEANNLSDLTNAATARTNLGLGTAATRDVGESAGNLMEVGAFGVGAAKFYNTAQNFNNFTTSGEYAFTALSNPNAPTINRFYLKVISYEGGQAVQTATSIVATNLQETYTRWFDSVSTWTPWVKTYHTGNILGTVSQSGGVPTGAIIESGSNANGQYVKYADGTMICTADSLTITANSNTTISFPSTFVSTTRCIITGDLAAATNNYTFGSNTAQGSVSIRAVGIAGSVTLGYIAIGRWY